MKNLNIINRIAVSSLTGALVIAINLFFLALTSCSDSEPVAEQEEEVITTLTMTFVPEAGQGTTKAVVLKFYDPDGETGPTAPIVTTDPFEAGVTYNATIELLNEFENPPENITDEVNAEGVDHLFIFKVSSPDEIFDGTVTYVDQDNNGDPIGTETIWNTQSSAPATGLLVVILLHQPDKSEWNSGDLSALGGETDIEVTFNVSME